MYTIGQFSKITKVTTKALRHYEKIGLLSPAWVDNNNQYRYYTEEQISSMDTILFLKDVGIPLNTIKNIIEKNNNMEEIASVLQEHRKLLLSELDKTNSRLIKLARLRKTLEAKEVKENTDYDIRIRDVQETLVYSVRKQMANLPESLPATIRTLLEEIQVKGGVCAGAPIMMYYDEEFDPEKVDLEVAWPVTDSNLANSSLPAVRAASYIYIGPYDGLESAYKAMFSWINENGMRAVFPIREISINDPQTTPPDKLATEIIIPVEPA